MKISKKGRSIIKATRTEKLLENVGKYPTNLQAVFRLTAKQVGGNPSQMHSLWYGGKNVKGVRHTNTAFITLTQFGMTQQNVKNSPVIKELKKSLKLKDTLISLKGMDVATKASILDMLIGK